MQLIDVLDLGDALMVLRNCREFQECAEAKLYVVAMAVLAVYDANNIADASGH